MRAEVFCCSVWFYFIGICTERVGTSLWRGRELGKMCHLHHKDEENNGTTLPESYAARCRAEGGEGDNQKR